MTQLPSSVLVVGSGGREHALIRAIAASPASPRLLAAPGNPGMAADGAACHAVKADDIPGLVALAQAEKVDFVVVGPEVPLALGLVDALADAGIPAYGPKKDGGELEASKILTKQILLKYGIPTAPAGIFDEVEPALTYLRERGAPIVVKADGLAAGKGVIVAATLDEAEAGVRDMLSGNKFGEAGSRVLIEDCLEGEETSILVVVSGTDYLILPTSQDHKRIREGDTGPNTGGMGTYSPAEVVTPELLAQIDREIVLPSVEAIANEGIDFRGTLFIGIMLTAEGPSVLEYNTRFGDPETQVVLPRLGCDVLELLWRAAQGKLAGFDLQVHEDSAAMCVVIAADGYPGDYPKGDPISVPEPLPSGVAVIHAGTSTDEAGQLVSAGGRVLGVTALAPTLRAAADAAYETCEAIGMATKVFRRDIGARQFGRHQ
ncbi:phosphoribosylamine--glycine ligase [Actomonas aquatica]|uniref:Phosphoribosylamine--glycine ligase n=1 Tax=Actomonas aquatica TaxID=2866162 RepID=A0ABZ1CAI7_9BACT|nr:phosphoribosylamine--glycine ligase [Opitutus sp. WL0086]WRQ88551.1 phosphoribosylamine--glycine ligase [Opitutus sp. WL0086]